MPVFDAEILSATTTIIPVKAALVAAGQALSEDPESALYGVTVSWSEPVGKLEREHMWFGSTSTPDVQAQSDYDGDRDDTYQLEFVVTVAEQGAQAEDVERRAGAILAAFELWMRGNPTAGLDIDTELPGVDDLVVEFVGADLTGYLVDQGRAADFTGRINVKALI